MARRLRVGGARVRSAAGITHAGLTAVPASRGNNQTLSSAPEVTSKSGMTDASLVPVAHEGQDVLKSRFAMNRRGRLAQLLTSKGGRRAFAAPERAHDLAWSGSPGWPRTIRRAFITLIELQIPRGAGASAVALFLLSTVVYGVVRGDHAADVAANVQDLCDDAANAVGFRISEVALTGEHQLSRERILASAGITDRTSLLFLDAVQARARLLTNPWIAEATVLKLYPGRMRVEIKERSAFALWQKDGKVSLISADGTVLEPSVPARFAALPLVVGNGAEHQAPGMLALVARYPLVANQLQASVLVAERRWNLYLTNGVTVLLPEADPEQGLKTLVDLDRAKKLLSRDIVAVDLRLTDRVTVRQSDAAAAARDEVLKAADKAAKKKKGSEA
jgi:cell division protein FtsQ